MKKTTSTYRDLETQIRFLLKALDKFLHKVSSSNGDSLYKGDHFGIVSIISISCSMSLLGGTPGNFNCKTS